MVFYLTVMGIVMIVSFIISLIIVITHEDGYDDYPMMKGTILAFITAPVWPVWIPIGLYLYLRGVIRVMRG